MSDIRETLAQLPPRLTNVGVKLLNWIEHTKWEHGHHANEALQAMAEEILRLRAHLGRREQYLLDEAAIHPNLPRRSDQQFGHAIHSDTCPMCADDARVYQHLRESGDRSEAGRVAYVGGLHEIENYLTEIKQRAKVGDAVPATSQLVDGLLKALKKIGDRATRAWSK